MLITLKMENNNFIVDKVFADKLKGESIVILCGQCSQELEESLIESKNIILKIDESLDIQKQYKNKKYIIDLIDFIDEKLEFRCPIFLLINKKEKDLSTIINYYSERINSVVVISDQVINNITVRLPLLNVCSLKTEISEESKYPILFIKNRAIKEYTVDIITWVKITYHDNNKLEYPMLKRINSEELSCKMIDLTDSNEVDKKQQVKIKII